MKNFTVGKYASLMRSSLMVDRKLHAVFVVMLTLLFLLFFIFYNALVKATVVGLSPAELMVNMGMYGFFKIVILLSIVAVVVGFSSAHSVYFLGKDDLRYASMMRPATNMERYAVVLTHSFLIAIFDSLLAFAVADLLQWFVTGNVPTDYFADVDWNYVYITGILPKGSEAFMDKCIVVAAFSILFSSAWFSLCATIFSRHPFIFGLLLLWVMTQIVSLALFLVVGFSTGLDSWRDLDIDNFSTVQILASLDSFANWVIALMSLATVVFFAASYIRMKKVAKFRYD
ncbi:MAG: hypothetical protein MJ002_05165 [Paludibacteraceae bacterium]|nr:hypothetical protein [Paludibacteraceae bacterium]